MRRSFAPRLATALAIAALIVAVPVASATNLSDFTVLPATGGSDLPAGSAEGPWTSIAGPVIEVTPYSNPDVLPEGTRFVLELPDGYVWDADAVELPTVAPSPGMPAGFCDLRPGRLEYAGRVLSLSLAGMHDIGCRIAFSGLRVRAGAGTTPDGGEITVGWSVPGLGSASAPGGAVAVVAAADDETPVIAPATGEGSVDLGLLALAAVVATAIGIAIGGAVLLARRRPTSPT